MRAASSSSVRVFYPRYSRDEVLNGLAEGVAALKEELPLARVVLFGSYASGRHAVGSDIDVLVVYSGERREDAFKVVKQTLALAGVEPHVYTEEEARAVEPTLRRMAEQGVVLYPPAGREGPGV